MTLLMRPEPFSGDVNRLFNTLLGSGERSGGLERWSPAMDLVENEDHFVLRADLPGLTEEDIDIEIRDNTLRVAGERKSEHEQRERGWYRMERSFGRFSRSLTLPEGVDSESVTASFDRGVLEVRVPKPEQRQPHRVQIEAGDSKPAVDGTATER